MQFLSALALLAPLASAHFRVPYPGERNATNYDTQTTGPCGGDNEVVLPRYKWNPKGSPLDVNMFHEEAVGAIFYCNGNDCSTNEDFNMMIWKPFDTIGAGNFCLPALPIPDEFNKVGNNGTIQIIFAGTGEEAGEYDYMYNCVDITISEDGEEWDDQCANSTTVEYDAGAEKYLEKDVNTKFSFVAMSEVPTFTLLDAFYSSTVTQTSTTEAEASSSSEESSSTATATDDDSDSVVTYVTSVYSTYSTTMEMGGASMAMLMTGSVAETVTSTVSAAESSATSATTESEASSSSSATTAAASSSSSASTSADSGSALAVSGVAFLSMLLAFAL